MMHWPKLLFAFLSRNTPSSSYYFHLPPDRVIELGVAIEYNGLKNFLDMLKSAMGNLPLRMLEGL